MNKHQLASTIWESANQMRSKIEANEYKDFILGFIFLNRSNAPALLAKSRACDRLQPTQGALAPQGFSGRLQLPLKF